MQIDGTFLAADFGAGSGRIIAGSLRHNRLELKEIHRFANHRVQLGQHTYWDFPMLYTQMLEGLRKAASIYSDIVSIGIDTWGVDFGLVDHNGALLGLPICYRDDTTAPFPARLQEKISPRRLYTESGLQPMAINSIYRLMAMQHEQDPKLATAKHLLFMPDLLSYYLCGVAANEYTIASTSQLLDAHTRNWNKELISLLNLPEHIFCPIVDPGTHLGTILPHIAEQTGLSPQVKVAAVGGHDTACAVHAAASTPYYTPGATAFLSSGTWSLLGVELPSPVTSESARQAGFANEGGACHRIHFLQNITGLWILQRLVEEWKQRNMECDYPQLVEMAEQSTCSVTINVDHSSFANPSSMSQAITDYCIENSLTPPASQGDMVRCVLLSLADRYRKGIEHLNTLTPTPVSRIHIIGGGSRNRLLNTLTAQATGMEVTAGPAEATAIGNILIQAQAAGAIESATDITEIIEP
ncbi:MAG: rhamnulokinase [Paramuribaculum sp.]|nr:rhamnulokinase [Paramuribaculum sp.]